MNISTNSLQSQNSIYMRTTLDERVYAISGGCELIAITLLPRILPLSYQTIKNKIWLNTFPLEIIRFNSKNYVRTKDVISLIEGGQNQLNLNKKKSGRKSNKEKATEFNRET